MPTDLAVTGIPDEVVLELTITAAANHRTLNAEIIARLERKAHTSPASVIKLLNQIREIRSRIDAASFDHEAIDSIKRSERA